jgi:hypothetical protein
MFAKLFSKNERAGRREDHVWTSDAARRTGFVREALRLAQGGSSVVAVAREMAQFEELCAALQERKPFLCRDLFAQKGLLARFEQPKAIAIALVSALPRNASADAGSSPAPHSNVPIELLVFGRHRRRDEDEAIVDFANSLGGRAGVTFHLSFEDPILRSTGAEIRPLLKALGLHPDEAITHSLVTRAIEKAQRSSGE